MNFIEFAWILCRPLIIGGLVAWIVAPSEVETQ